MLETGSFSHSRKTMGTDTGLGSTCRWQPPHRRWKMVQHPAEEPSCLARRPHPRPLRPPNKGPGRAAGAGRFSEGGFPGGRGGCDAGSEMGRQLWVPVRSIAPASPPVPGGAAAAGRPRGTPRGLLRSARTPCLEPSRSPGAGTGGGFSRRWGFPSSGIAYGLHVALLHTRTNIHPRDSLDIKKALITII